MGGKRTGRDRTGEGPGRAASAAQVERALTALEEVVLAGRVEEIPRWTALLWSNREEARRALLRRLETGPVRVPGLYLDVLSGLAGSQAQALMRRVASNAAVADVLRLEARRRAGWPERTEARARVTFLRSLRDPAAAMAALIASGCGLPVPDGEGFGEALAYLLAMTGEERRAALTQAVQDAGASAAWLLRALLAAPDTPTRGLALQSLLTLRDRGALAAIDRLARLSPGGPLAEAAQVALRRLALRAIPGAGAAPRQPPAAGVGPRGGPAQEPVPAFERAVVTAIDGDGGQALTLVRAWDSELRLVVQVFLRDDAGIVDTYGLMRLPREQVAEMLRLLGDKDCPLVGLSLAEAREVVLWAAERSLLSGRLPPPAFALWEPYFFDDLRPAPPAAPPAAPALAGEAVPPPGERVADLLASPFCDSWHFPPEDLAPALAALAGDGPLARARYAALLRQVCPPAVRHTLALRLRRQAWLLERSGRGDLRDAALGCAAGLERELDPAGLPLLRGMLARGLAALRSPSAPGKDEED